MSHRTALHLHFTTTATNAGLIHLYRTDELDLFKAVMKWGVVEKKRLEAAAVQAHAEGEAAAADDNAEGEGRARAPAPDMHMALQGVIACVRFPLISPENLRDFVQPEMEMHNGIPERYFAAVLWNMECVCNM